MLTSLIEKQRRSIDFFFENLDLYEIQALIDHLNLHQGIVFFTGVGKSGFIAQKLAKSFISIGIKALFLPPQDALHGDIGIVSSNDTVIMLSKSGNTEELIQLVPYLKSKGAFTIALVCDKGSKLSKIVQQTYLLPFDQELCPFNMVPTVSTTLQLLFGDILTVALIHSKKLSLEQFAQNHPAGKIGKILSLRVKDIMLSGNSVPHCSEEITVFQALTILSSKGCGCVLVIDENQQLKGIFTDGDLRRAIENFRSEALEMPLKKVMTLRPKTCSPEMLAAHALEFMEQKPCVTQLPVVVGHQLIGLLRMHDLVQIGIL